MSFLLSCARKDLLRQLRDPVSLVTWVGIPVIVAALVLFAFGGEGGPTPTARVLVANEDEGFLGQLLLGALPRAGGVIDAESVSREEGRALIDDGKASAFLIIPTNFSRAVLREEPATLQLVTNPSQSILPGIAEEVLSVMTDAVFYVQRLLGERLRELSEGPPPGLDTFPDGTIGEFSEEVNRLIGRVDDLLFPPAIRLETRVEADDGAEAAESVDFGALFFPGILFMALLFVAQGLSSDAWTEIAQGTLRRSLAAPPGVRVFLAGKLLAGAAIIAGVCAVALSIGIVLFGLRPGVLPLGVVWCVFAGTVFLTALLLIQLLARTARGAGVVTSLIVFPLIFVGGSFFPFEAMPEGLARIGRATPNGWALEQLKAILWGRVEPAALLTAFAGLSAVGVILFLLCARRMRRRYVGA